MISTARCCMTGALITVMTDRTQVQLDNCPSSKYPASPLSVYFPTCQHTINVIMRHSLTNKYQKECFAAS